VLRLAPSTSVSAGWVAYLFRGLDVASIAQPGVAPSFAQFAKGGTATDIFLSSNNFVLENMKYVVCFVLLTAIAAPIARFELAYQSAS
jgi:hypothetical protein